MSCGCNSNSNQGNSCYNPATVQQQLVLPVYQNDCTTNCQSTNGIEGCPAYFQPWTVTADVALTIPAVGGTMILTVCNAERFVVGMWVQGTALGKYPIVAINKAQNTVTVQNGCANGEAIGGNPVPGSVITGQQAIWVIASGECEDSALFQEKVFDAFAEQNADNLLCLRNVATTSTGECIYLYGLTAACNSGDCPPVDDPNCLKKNPYVRFCKDSMWFDEGLQTADTSGDICYTPVVVSDEGQIVQASGGNLVYINKINLDDRNSGYTDGTGVSSAMNYSVNAANYGVPDCAKGVLLRMFYQFDNDDEGGLVFMSYVRGDGQPTNNVNYLMLDYEGLGDEAGGDRRTSTGLYTTVLFGNNNKLIFHEWVNNGTEGSNNRMRVFMAIDAYLM